MFIGSGYPQDPCQDIDECESETHNCDGLNECVNRIGSFGCRCPSGFLREGEQQRYLCRTSSVCDVEGALTPL